MSRSRKGTKAPGYEYWSSRPISNRGGATPGHFTKKRTHKAERQQEKRCSADEQQGGK